MWRPALVLLLTALPSLADVLAAGRVIRAGTVLEAEDLVFVRNSAGGLRDPAAVVGREARITLYAGRPIRPQDIGAPALIERNQLVPLVYQRAGLEIRLEGRALERGGLGESIRVMNLQSRSSVVGRVRPDGAVEAGALAP